MYLFIIINWKALRIRLLLWSRSSRDSFHMFAEPYTHTNQCKLQANLQVPQKTLQYYSSMKFLILKSALGNHCRYYYLMY